MCRHQCNASPALIVLARVFDQKADLSCELTACCCPAIEAYWRLLAKASYSGELVGFNVEFDHVKPLERR
jgi:hypothetical protein